MMNLPLLIGLLVLHGVYTYPMNTSIHHQIVKRTVTPADLAQINRVRQEMGKQVGIRMPDLVWDEQLVRTAASLNEPHCDYKHAHNYRFFPDDPDENGAKLVTFIAKVIGVAAEAQKSPLNPEVKAAIDQFANMIDAQINNPKFSMFHFEVLNPAQTKMGCVPKKCSEPLPPFDQQVRDYIGLTGDTVGFGSLCLIGPSARWDPSDFKKVGSR